MSCDNLAETLPTATMRVLIAGCGDLGTRVGLRLGAAGARVYGLRRQPQSLPAPLQPIAADLVSGAGLEALPGEFDCVIYAPTPAARDAEGYRAIYVDGLHRLLEQLSTGSVGARLIYVSSSAVYAEDFGAAVDESSPTGASTFNGVALLQGEAVAQASGFPSVCLRLAGIYGPQRLWMLRRARSGQPIAQGPRYGNRIHIDDAADLVTLLASCPAPPPCVIGVDDQPVPESEVLDWLCAQLGLPLLPRLPDSAGARGKRLSNRLARSLGWQPRYCAYRDGYQAIVSAQSSRSPAP